MRPTRYRARWIVPVSAPSLRDGALLVGPDGRIAALGPTDAVPLPPDAEEVDLGEAALLPGLVNVHTHPDISYLRGLLEDLEFPDWIAALLRVRREATLSAADFLAAARWSCLEMVAAGVTTVGATEDSAGAFDALLESGQRGVVFREVFGPSPDQAANAMAGLHATVTAERSRETDLVRIGISPHAPYSVSDELFAAAARFALDHQLPVAVHTAESRAETDLVRNGAGPFAERLAQRGIPTAARARSTVELLSRTGILDTRPLLIHCVQVDRADIEMIEAAGAMVAHCPAANARLGHGIAPVCALIDAGITVALGSDSVGSNNRVDILEEARLAQMFQRATTHSADALPAERVLRMATLDGAASLGLAGRVGALEPGMEADLCAIRLDRPHTRPVHDPVAAIVHAARASDVILTAVRGRVLARDGRATGLDVASARDAIDELADRVRSALVVTAHGAGRRHTP